MANYNVKKTKFGPEKGQELSEKQIYLNNLLTHTNFEIKKVNKYLSDLNKTKRIIKELIEDNK